jgi:hypothetical protein
MFLYHFGTSSDNINSNDGFSFVKRLLEYNAAMPPMEADSCKRASAPTRQRGGGTQPGCPAAQTMWMWRGCRIGQLALVLE